MSLYAALCLTGIARFVEITEVITIGLQNKDYNIVIFQIYNCIFEMLKKNAAFYSNISG